MCDKNIFNVNNLFLQNIHIQNYISKKENLSMFRDIYFKSSTVIISSLSLVMDFGKNIYTIKWFKIVKSSVNIFNFILDNLCIINLKSTMMSICLKTSVEREMVKDNCYGCFGFSSHKKVLTDLETEA